MVPLAGLPPGPRRRDQALAFIIDRIVQSGISPTYDEIGSAIGVRKTRVAVLVRQLEREGLIERVPGTQRAIRVRDVSRARGIVDQTLRRLGWIAAEPLGVLEPPCTQVHLPIAPPFRHLPDIE